jgi:hypothetical protein
MTTEEASVAESLEGEAARYLGEALELVAHLRGREPRERHRRLLELAIEQAERALAAAEGGTMRPARSILARAHMARAEDACAMTEKPVLVLERFWRRAPNRG